MNLRIFLLSVFLLHSTIFFAQKSRTLTDFEKEFKSRSSRFLNNNTFSKAQTFFFAKEWDSTLVYTSKGLNGVNGNKEFVDYCYYLRAYSFKRKRLYRESEKEFAKISEEFDFYNRIKVYLGEIALEEGQFKKAIEYFERVNDVNTYEMAEIEKNDIEHNLGLCYLHLEKFDKAEYYLLKTIRSLEIEKDTIELVGSYGDMANLYYVQYKDDEAIPYFEKAYALSKYTKRFDLKQNTALNMSVVEENRKKYVKSLTYRKEYEQWKDSLTDQNKIYEVAQLEKKFAVKEKQKEVSLLLAINKLKIAERNGFLYSAIILLFLLGTLFYSYRGKIKRNKIITAQKETLNTLNDTKDKLFSIVSHDLRSSVNAIRTSNKKVKHSLETKNLEELNKLLEQNSAVVNGAYGLLDNLLHWALLQTRQSYFEITSIRLSSIVEQVAYNYIPLMEQKNIVFENRVLKSIIVEVDQESLKIVLRNLLDNAIKFSKPEGSILVYTEDSDEMYCDLIVKDSGIGMDEDTQTALMESSKLLSKKKSEKAIGTGLGLHLVKSMMVKNSGKFSIESQLGKGTKMIISLPKKSHNG
ncbi:tetratricopeptide repeat-containing sensor histidine kinase [Flavobacteriaceae bacterium S356]|uniref:histidine kinase n=1 Tax=Asprobacillus argus TaxID=3076534 RepID=A0ABU3LG44_9FLAO|nr:tetratricopeptide repeat-containing sensor histidine kinase [Flavobacteriaceae bacterium S356]